MAAGFDNGVALHLLQAGVQRSTILSSRPEGCADFLGNAESVKKWEPAHSWRTVGQAVRGPGAVQNSHRRLLFLELAADGERSVR